MLFRSLLALGAAHGLTPVTKVNWGLPLYSALKAVTSLDADRALAAFANGRYSTLQRALCHVLYAVNLFNAPTSTFGCQLFVLFRKA